MTTDSDHQAWRERNLARLAEARRILETVRAQPDLRPESRRDAEEETAEGDPHHPGTPPPPPTLDYELTYEPWWQR